MVTSALFIIARPWDQERQWSAGMKGHSTTTLRDYLRKESIHSAGRIPERNANWQYKKAGDSIHTTWHFISYCFTVRNIFKSTIYIESDGDNEIPRDWLTYLPSLTAWEVLTPQRNEEMLEEMVEQSLLEMTSSTKAVRKWAKMVRGKNGTLETDQTFTTIQSAFIQAKGEGTSTVT